MGVSMRRNGLLGGVMLVALLVMLFGCQTAYYATLEQFGVEKRDILVDRVEEAREAQTDAKAQFESALEQFLAVTGHDGGEIEERYRRLKSAFEASEAEAERVRERIEEVEQVAEDLFAEWRRELELYSESSLRRRSAAQLKETAARYEQLIGAMHRAAALMDPVLATFRDRVLFLKHNLNAQAIGALRLDAAEVRADVRQLIDEMQASIAEADAFIQAMSNTNTDT